MEREDITRKHIALGIVLLLIGGYFAVGTTIDMLNDATRADLSKHVSNKSCGFMMTNTSPDAMCPGELRCFTNIDADRAGVNVSGGHCVTPTYEERYCGIFEVNILHKSGPPSMGTCGSYSDQYSYSLADYVSALWKEDLYDRIFNTDQNGEELIQEHGLALAKEGQDTVR